MGRTPGSHLGVKIRSNFKFLNETGVSGDLSVGRTGQLPDARDWIYALGEAAPVLWDMIDLLLFRLQISHEALKRLLVRLAVLPITEIRDEVFPNLAGRILADVRVKAFPVANR
jgi:hypothetical protein